MKRHANHILAAALIASVLPGMAGAQSARIGVHRNEGGAACSVDIAAGAVITLPVRLDGALGPVKTAKFRIATSQPLVPVSPPNLEFDLTFAVCANAGETIGQITVLNPGGALTGVDFDVVPATGETKIPVTDCEGHAMRGEDSFGWTEPCDDMSGYLAPYRPDPPDGATGVPLDATLSFVGSSNYVQITAAPFTWDAPAVCIGPYLSNPLGLPPCTLPIDPGPLQPGTTYYWMAWVLCTGCYHGESAVSEVFLFTTTAPVAAESATWGRVKSMYRE